MIVFFSVSVVFLVWPPLGHGAATMSLLNLVLSFTNACASPHDKPISLSSLSTFLSLGCFGSSSFLMPAGIHLKNLGYPLWRHLWYMSQPSKLAFLVFKIAICTYCLLIQAVVGNFARPEDVTDLSRAAVVKALTFIMSVLIIPFLQTTRG